MQRSLFFIFLAILSYPLFGEAEFITISDALSKAESETKNVLLNYEADWCLPCNIMKENVLSNKKVKNALDNNFVYLDVDISNPTYASWLNEYSYACLPAFLMIDKEGTIIEELAGTSTTSEFLSFLERHNIHEEGPSKSIPDNSVTTKVMMNHIPITKDVTPVFTIAVGAFSVLENAMKQKEKIEKLTGHVVDLEIKDNLHKLSMGKYATREQASIDIKFLKQKNIDHYIKHIK